MFPSQGSRRCLKHSLQFCRGSTPELKEDLASPIFQAGLKRCHKDANSACYVTLHFRTFSPKRRPTDGQQDAGPKKPPRAPIIGVLPCSPSSYLPFSFYFLCSLSLQPQLRDATSPWGQWPWPFGGVIIQVSGSNEIILSNEAAYLCPPLSPNFLPLLENSQPSGKLEGRGVEKGRG